MPCIPSPDPSPSCLSLPCSPLPCSPPPEPAPVHEDSARLTASRSASSPKLVYLFKKVSFPRVEPFVLSFRIGLQPEHLENGKCRSSRRMKNRRAKASLEDEGRGNHAPQPGAL